MAKKKIRILSWNVNGIRAISRKGFFEWLKKDSPSILCLQETKAHPEQLDSALLEPKGYTALWNNPKRKGYAGVSIFTNIKPQLVEEDFPPKSFDTEGRMLLADFKEFVLKITVEFNVFSLNL